MIWRRRLWESSYCWMVQAWVSCDKRCGGSSPRSGPIKLQLLVCGALRRRRIVECRLLTETCCGCTDLPVMSGADFVLGPDVEFVCVRRSEVLDHQLSCWNKEQFRCTTRCSNKLNGGECYTQHRRSNMQQHYSRLALPSSWPDQSVHSPLDKCLYSPQDKQLPATCLHKYLIRFHSSASAYNVTVTQCLNNSSIVLSILRSHLAINDRHLFTVHMRFRLAVCSLSLSFIFCIIVSSLLAARQNEIRVLFATSSMCYAITNLYSASFSRDAQNVITDGFATMQQSIVTWPRKAFVIVLLVFISPLRAHCEPSVYAIWVETKKYYLTGLQLLLRCIVGNIYQTTTYSCYLRTCLILEWHLEKKAAQPVIQENLQQYNWFRTSIQWWRHPPDSLWRVAQLMPYIFPKPYKPYIFLYIPSKKGSFQQAV